MSEDKVMEEKNLHAWQTGIDSEIEFWRNMLIAKGSWIEGRVDPERRLDEYVAKYVTHSAKRVCILDVGAGPLTSLGKKLTDHDIEITPIDALARHYDLLLDELSIVPIIRTQYGEVENLSEQFPQSYFDIVHCRNALDHTYNPVRGIMEMLSVVKPSGYIILNHAINEAENQHYYGLHQWNLCSHDGDFLIWNKDRTFNVNELLKDVAKVTMNTDCGWVLAVICPLTACNHLPIQLPHRIQI